MRVFFTHIIQANQLSHVISKYTNNLLVLNPKYQNIISYRGELRVIYIKNKYNKVLNTNTSTSSNVYQKKLFHKKTSESWG